MSRIAKMSIVQKLRRKMEKKKKKTNVNIITQESRSLLTLCSAFFKSFVRVLKNGNFILLLISRFHTSVNYTYLYFWIDLMEKFKIRITYVLDCWQLMNFFRNQNWQNSDRLKIFLFHGTNIFFQREYLEIGRTDRLGTRSPGYTRELFPT